MEKDGPTSILRINSVTYRDCGEIRCTASVTGGRGPSISCATDLRFMKFAGPRDRSLSPAKKMTLSPLVRRSMRISTNPYRQEDKENVNRMSPIPKDDTDTLFKKSHISQPFFISRNDVFCTKTGTQNSEDVRNENKLINEDMSDISKLNKNRSLRTEYQNQSKTTEENESDLKIDEELDRTKGKPVECCVINQNSIQDDKNAKSVGKESPLEPVKPEMTTEIRPTSLYSEIKVKEESQCLERYECDEPAVVLQAPSDVIALRGSTVVLNVSYRGHPEPRVRWLQAVS